MDQLISTAQLVMHLKIEFYLVIHALAILDIGMIMDYVLCVIIHVINVMEKVPHLALHVILIIKDILIIIIVYAC